MLVNVQTGAVNVRVPDSILVNAPAILTPPVLALVPAADLLKENYGLRH